MCNSDITQVETNAWSALSRSSGVVFTLTGRVEVDEVAGTVLGAERPRRSFVPAAPAIPRPATVGS